MLAMLAVTRTTQMLDTSGTTAAAHSISLQLFNLGSVASLALSISSSSKYNNLIHIKRVIYC